jgi:membrane associated rhomboid family serine protease
MLDSIYRDIKRQVQSGNMITRIILINIAVFIVLNLTRMLGPEALDSVLSFVKLPSDPLMFLKRFWTLVTYMFTQIDFFHILWNMLLLYWFGKIFGDFIGDHKVLPLYLMAGVVGGMVFILTDFLPTGTGGSATVIGASAAVMGIMVATATLSPDYSMRLILLGDVKIKWIVLVFFILDIFRTVGSGNEGGHWAHIGGAVFGYLYIVAYRRGTNLTAFLEKLFDRDLKVPARRQAQPARPSVVRKASRLSVVHKKENQQSASISDEEKLDKILDKIKAQGYDKLSQAEKDYLKKMSDS